MKILTDPSLVPFLHSGANGRVSKLVQDNTRLIQRLDRAFGTGCFIKGGHFGEGGKLSPRYRKGGRVLDVWLLLKKMLIPK